ncbi:hypothetical protein TPA0910_24280 [Streptomyces hygroscopicus subsp. sporocinereus]|uniref:Uncharacterized protein n=2 Tax=Streptomyces hygroscopicus TaxID=1912 RepID=A0ABQ3TXD0_STRHY|nr:hypothetical protein TPA0910_24280 [Streptomyces hygroscopicus]
MISRLMRSWMSFVIPRERACAATATSDPNSLAAVARGDQSGEVRIRYPPCALAGGGGHDAAVLVVAELSAGAVLHARVPGRDFAAPADL